MKNSEKRCLKKILSISLIILLLGPLASPIISNATTFSVTLTNTATSIAAGDVVEVKIRVTGGAISSFSGYFEYDTTKLQTPTKTSVVLPSDLTMDEDYGMWTRNYSTGNKITITENSGNAYTMPGDGLIATVKFTALTNITTTDIKLNTVILVDSNVQNVNIGNLTCTVPNVPVITSYDVTYNANVTDSSVTNMPSNGAKDVSSEYIIRSAPTRTGYAFTGWNTLANGSGTTYQPGSSYTTNATLNLYAQWQTVQTVSTYPVTYNGNATGVTGVPSAETKIQNTAYNIRSGPTRSGYAFAGWNTSPTRTGTMYQPGATYTTNAALTLYAQWDAVVTVPTYAITYNGNGTGATETPTAETKTQGVAYTIRSGPTRSGYTFKNWNTAANGSGTTYQPGATYATNAALTLYAQWNQVVTLATYSIVYNGNGGTNVPATGTKTQNEEYIIRYAPTKSGYRFTGWNTALAGTGTWYQPGDAYTGNARLDLYAQWEEEVILATYTITYNQNGTGATGTPTAETKTQDVSYNIRSGPTKSGYTFKGWNTAANGSGTTYQPGDIYAINAATTLYAQWEQVTTAATYAITYNANGGTNAPTAGTKTQDIEYIIRQAPTKSGYTFKGWNTVQTGTGTSYQPGDVYSNNATLTLYAQWEQVVTVATYSITYNGNGTGATGTPTAETKTEGVAYNIRSGPTRSGYTFKGWNTVQAGTGTMYQPGSSYTTNAALTLYAQWEAVPTLATYTITYNANQGTNGPANGTKTQGADYIIRYAPTRTGYIFKGWNTASNGSGTAYQPGAVYTTDAVLTLYAQWEQEVNLSEYTITYNGNGTGVTGVPTGETKTQDIAYNIRSGPIRDGYIFKGWNTVQAGTGVWYQPGDAYLTNAVLTLYAQWEQGTVATTYAITYNANEGANAPANGTKTENVDYIIRYAPSRSGYSFTGWNTVQAGTGTMYQPGDTYTTNAVLTLYAQWVQTASLISYAITYNQNGTGARGTPIGESKTHDVGYNIRSGPTKTGYTFKSWNTQADGSGTTYLPGASYFTNAALSLYAQWEEVVTLATYAITYNGNGTGTTGVLTGETKTQDTDYIIRSGPTRSGFTFTKWNTQADGNGVDYLPGTAYTANTELALYAQWEEVVNLATYTITYNANQGTNGPTNGTKTQDVEYVIRSAPTRSGYTFKGWNTAQAGTGTMYQPGDVYVTNAVLTLYAQWEQIQTVATYAITYNGNGTGATGVPTGETKTQDVVYNIRSAATRSGYTFKGWNTLANGSGVTYQPGATYATNAALTLYAQWEEVVNLATYTITYNANGGTNAPTAGTKTENQDYVVRYAPSRNGYIFTGWNTIQAGTGTMYQPGAVYVANVATTLYAQWQQEEVTATYTITYNGNGTGTTGIPTGETKVQDIAYNISYAPTRSGYTFAGWNTNASGNGTTYQPGDAYTTNANLVLYAKWNAIVIPATYAIKYIGNQGVNAPADETKTQNIDYTIRYAPTKEGYTFIEWNTNDNGDGTAYQPGATYATNAALTLYAQWQEIPVISTYPITYNANGGTNAPTSDAKTQDVVYNIRSGATRTGYTFKGWNTVQAGTGTMYQPGDSYTGNAPLTLYAQWEVTPVIQTYTITYNANQGTNAPASDTKTQDVVYNIRSGATRTGYTFKGWNTAQAGTGTIYQPGDVYTANANLTLYAQWEAIPVIATYTITYNQNGTGAMGMPTNDTKTQNVVYTIRSAPTKAGYTFKGWNTLANGSGVTYQPGSSYATNAALTLYAQWQEIANVVTYQITYNGNGSGATEIPTGELKTQGNNYTIRSEASRDGYTFTGWNNNVNGIGTMYQPGDIYSTDSALTLYAQWEETVVVEPVKYFVKTSAQISNDNAQEFTTVEEAKNYINDTLNRDLKIYDINNDLIYELPPEVVAYAIRYKSNVTDNSAMNMPTDEVKVQDIDYVIRSAPRRTGYEFIGWNTIANGAGTTYQAGEKYIIDEVLTLYAQWQRTASAVTYAISYNANTNDQVTGVPANETKTQNVEYTVRSGPIREGYTFRGWNTISDGSGIMYLAGEKYALDQETVLYAQWRVAQLGDKTIAYYVKENSNINNNIAREFDTIEEAKAYIGENEQLKVYDANNSLIYQYVKDVYLNSKWYKIGEGDTNVYEKDDLFIEKIKPRTILNEFVENCETNGEIVVYRVNGEKVKIDEFVGTGMIMKITKGKQVITLTLSVLGDLDGNGLVTITDLSTLNKQVVRVLDLYGARARAADLDFNGSITVTDLSRLKQALVERVIL